MGGGWRRWGVGLGLAALAGSGARLEARPWRKAVAAAMAAVVLGSGAAHPALAPAAASGAGMGLPPFPGPFPVSLPPGLDPGWDPAGAAVPDSDGALAGACGQACEHQFNLGLIHCETYLQLRALRNLCLTQVLAAEGDCALGCGRR